jgi:hypothetical protein
MQRATSLCLTLLRMALMTTGLVALVGALAIIQSDGPLVQRVQSWFVPSPAATQEAVELPEFSWGTRPVAEPVEVLSPKMRGALDYVSRRYRVSGEALEAIFVTAESAAREFRLDPLLIVAVIAIESRFNPFSESVLGAQGLMQVMPRVHQDKLPEGADELSMFDPVTNVRVGSRVLRDSIRRHGGVAPGLQQFGGASDDPEQRYAAKVLAEKARLDAAASRATLRGA